MSWPGHAVAEIRISADSDEFLSLNRQRQSTTRYDNIYWCLLLRSAREFSAFGLETDVVRLSGNQ